MGAINTASWQLGLFDSLTTDTLDTEYIILTKPQIVNTSQATYKPDSYIEHHDPLINRTIKVPPFPDNVLRRDVDKTDLFYNLRRIND